MIRRLLPSLFALSLLLAQPAQSHSIDPLELAPAAPAAGAPVEMLAGEVRELVVEDRVANVTVRYRSLALDDGSHMRLNGATQALAHGSRVQVTGRRNGNTLFVSDARTLGRSTQKSTAAIETGEVEGTLRMYYADFLEEGNSRLGHDVLGANDEVTPIRLGVHANAIQRGMHVVVRGPLAGDGAIEPEAITILALPDEPEDKVAAKAVKTDNVLVILMRFNDSPANPFTQAQVQAAWTGTGGVAQYYKEVSFNQQLLNVTVTPWLSTGAATPAGCNWSQMGSLGRTAAAAAGYPTTGYHKIVYVFPRVSSCGWLGLGYIGGSGAWINGSNTTLVYGHELGHNFGLLHAATLDCGAAVIGGTCSVAEYGDPIGIMGNSSTMHVNAFQKADMGWIPAATVRTHTAGAATYTLNPLETAGGSTYAVKVPAAANRTYWIEFRKPIGFDAGIASYPNNGAIIRVATPFETLCGGCDSYSNDTQLIDTTPATTTFTDAALLAGRSFTDTKYGITFNVLTATATALTVQVVGPGGAVSTTSLASALNPALLGASVAFTATVTGSSPTGNVTFRANGTAISGCSAVSLVGTGNSKTAVCATALLAVGAHSIVAQYNGDATNPSSMSGTVSQVINPLSSSINVALSSNGATASASSQYGPGYPTSSVINNDRKGLNWGAGGAWRDSTHNAFPDWVQVNFAGSKRIDRVVVYSAQNSFLTPAEPTDTMTGTSYVLRNFTVQGWNGSAWVTLATVTSNSLIKRTVTFAQFTTDRIRINITGTPDGASRMVEVEAWGVAAPSSVTSTALVSSANPATQGSSVTFNASVTGASPTGTVAFTANAVAISGCSAVALVGSGSTRTAACTVSTLTAGTHGIVARYSGDAANATSTSATLSQTIATVANGNVALASAGATASASSIYGSGYPVASVINNDRKGLNWGAGGAWRDGTLNVFPDWVQVNFAGSKRIDRVVVYSAQNSFLTPSEPTDTMTGTNHVLRNFTVQAWNGSAWVTLATVTSNSLIKRTVTFAQTTTDRIRINITSTPDGASRITEIEAFGY